MSELGLDAGFGEPAPHDRRAAVAFASAPAHVDSELAGFHRPYGEAVGACWAEHSGKDRQDQRVAQEPSVWSADGVSLVYFLLRLDGSEDRRRGRVSGDRQPGPHLRWDARRCPTWTQLAWAHVSAVFRTPFYPSLAECPRGSQLRCWFPLPRSCLGLTTCRRPGDHVYPLTHDAGGSHGERKRLRSALNGPRHMKSSAI